MELELGQLAKLNDIASRYDDIFADMDNKHDYINARVKLTKVLNAKVKVDLTLSELRVLQDVLDVELNDDNGCQSLDAVEAAMLYEEVSDAICAKQRRG